MIKPLSKNKKIILFLFINVLGFLLLTTASLAEDTTIMGGVSCTANGDCKLSDFMQVAIQVSKIILGLSGSAALLAFIAGGVMFLASGGNKTMIDRGKSAIIGATIGLVIVFASWMIINFILTTFGIASGWNTIKG